MLYLLTFDPVVQNAQCTVIIYKTKLIKDHADGKNFLII